MKKYIFSLLILAVLVTVNIPSLLLNFSNPCVYRACPDYGYGGAGLVEFVVDTTPPNFYIPAGVTCGFACINHEAYIDWVLFSFDMIVWLLATYFIFKKGRNKPFSTH